MRAWPALDIQGDAAAPVAGDRWDLLQAELTDYDVAAIDDNTPGRWRVFFHSGDARDRAAAAIALRFPAFAFNPVDVADEDWAARSQADLRSVRVGRLIVAPPWDIGRAFPDAPITIVIQPSMGFGTGHHATTRLCLEHLQHLDLRGRSALDVGTGSAVLAIAASRLGATHVLAIDDDPDAIQSARENLDLNPGAEVTLGERDVKRTTLRPFDVVLANLTGGLLVAAAGRLQALVAPRGRLVLSGFMEHEEPDVLEAFASCAVERRSQEDDWLCVTLAR